MIKNFLYTGRDLLIGLALVFIFVAVTRFGLVPAVETTGLLGETGNTLFRRASVLAAVMGAFGLFLWFTEKGDLAPVKFPPSALLWGLAGAVAIGLVMSVLFLSGAYTAMPQTPSAELLLLAVFILGAAALEEVVFRGILFGVLEKHLGFWTGLIAPSVLFSALHFFNAEWGGWLSFGSGLFLGVVWTMVYVLSRNIWAATLNHAAWNFTIVLAGVPLTGQDAWVEWAPLRTSISGPDWWAGGASGPEDTVLTVALTAVLSVASVVWYRRQGRA